MLSETAVLLYAASEETAGINEMLLIIPTFIIQSFVLEDLGFRSC